MPATCFNTLPRSAGVIAQRCRLSLQGLSERWLRCARFPAFRSGLYARVRYKCMHRRTARRLAPTFCTAAPRSS